MTGRHALWFTLVLFLVASSLRADDARSCESISRQSYLAHVSAASSALMLNQTEQAKRWLDATPDPFRDWEWHFLAAESDRSVGSLSFGDATPLSVEHHPTEPLVAVGMDDHSIRLVGTEPLGEIDRINQHEGVVYRAVFSPDGTRLASTGRDFKLRLIDLETRKELWSVSTPAQGISSLAFHPDGSRLALVSWHRPDDRVIGLVLVYAAATGEELERIEFGDKPIVAVEFNPDGRTLAVGTWGWRVALWRFPELGGPQVLDLDDVAVYAAIDDIAFSPDGSSIAAASKDRTARIWTLPEGIRRTEISGHTQPVAAIEFAPDGAVVATAGWDASIDLRDPRSGSRLATLHGHDRRIHDLAFSPDGATIVTVSADQTLRLWRPEQSLSFTNREGRHEHVYAFALSRDGSLLATGAPDGRLGIWSTVTGKLMTRTIPVAEGVTNAAGFSPDGTRIVSCTWDPPVIVTDATSGELLFKLEGPKRGSADCGFSPDGAFVFSSCSDGGLYLWDAPSGELKHRIDHEGSVAKTVWHRRLPRFGTVTGAGIVTMWDRKTMKPLWRSETGERGMALAISHDGSILASAGSSGTIRIWDAEDGSMLRELSGHSGGVWTLDFHPGGHRLASGSEDQSVRIWDPASGELALILPDWSQSVYNVVFSPDGSRLYVNSSGAEIEALEASIR